MSVIQMNFEKRVPMGEALHREAMTLFRQYIIIGGMPQAVQQDIAKHAKGYERKVEAIFDEIYKKLLLGKLEINEVMIFENHDGNRFSSYEKFRKKYSQRTTRAKHLSLYLSSYIKSAW